MYKNILLILVAAVFAISCNNQATTNDEQTAQEEEVVVVKEEPTMLSLADFQAQAENLVGKEVILEGDVIHVCKHGGKKMFITADDPDVRIKITTDGEMVAAFDTELEGSHVKVHGIVEAIESEVVGEGEHADEGEHENDEDHVNHYHKPQYSVAVLDYTVEQAEPDGE